MAFERGSRLIVAYIGDESGFPNGRSNVFVSMKTEDYCGDVRYQVVSLLWKIHYIIAEVEQVSTQSWKKSKI